MNEAIFCVDDRLIHGQILVGWIKPLEIKNVIVVNDFIFSSKKTQNIFLKISENLKILFHTPQNPLSLTFENERRMFLFESLQDAFISYKNGLTFNSLILIGIRKKEPRIEIPPFIYIDYEDIEYIIKFVKEHVKIVGKQFPHTKETDMEKELKKRNLL